MKVYFFIIDTAMILLAINQQMPKNCKDTDHDPGKKLRMDEVGELF